MGWGVGGRINEVEVHIDYNLRLLPRHPVQATLKLELVFQVSFFSFLPSRVFPLRKRILLFDCYGHIM